MKLKYIFLYTIEQVLNLCMKINEYRMAVQKDIHEIECGKNDLLSGIDYDTRQSLKLDNVPQRHIVKDPTLRQILINLENYERSIERLREELNEVFYIDEFYRDVKNQLSPKKRYIIESIYRDGKQIKYIAKELNITPSHCSRIHTQLLGELEQILSPLMVYEGEVIKKTAKEAPQPSLH